MDCNPLTITDVLGDEGEPVSEERAQANLGKEGDTYTDKNGRTFENMGKNDDGYGIWVEKTPPTTNAATPASKVDRPSNIELTIKEIGKRITTNPVTKYFDSKIDEGINKSIEWIAEEAGAKIDNLKDYNLQEGNISFGISGKLGPFSGSLKMEFALGKSSQDGFGDSDWNFAVRLRPVGTFDTKDIFKLKGWKGTGTNVKAGFGVKADSKGTVNTNLGVWKSGTYYKRSANLGGNGGDLKFKVSDSGTLSFNADITIGGRLSAEVKRSFGQEVEFQIAATATER